MPKCLELICFFFFFFFQVNSEVQQWKIGLLLLYMLFFLLWSHYEYIVKNLKIKTNCSISIQERIVFYWSLHRRVKWSDVIGASLENKISGAENQSFSCLCFGGVWAGSLLLTRTEHPLAVWTHCAHSWEEAFSSVLYIPVLYCSMTHNEVPYLGRIKEFKKTSLIQIKMLMLFYMELPGLEWDCILLSDREIF